MKAGGAMSVADLPVALRNRGRSRGENKCVNIVPPWLRFRGGPIEIAVTTTDREARDDLTARRAECAFPRPENAALDFLVPDCSPGPAGFPVAGHPVAPQVTQASVGGAARLFS